MSVTTSARMNPKEFASRVPGGAYSWTGGRLQDATAKTISVEGMTDAALQSAINAAAAVFVDYEANGAAVTARIAAAITANIAVLALPDPTPGNNTYLGLAAIPAGTLTAAVLGNQLRPVRLQVDALTRQNNALRDQVVALTRQITAIERHIGNKLDDVSGT